MQQQQQDSGKAGSDQDMKQNLQQPEQQQQQQQQQQHPPQKCPRCESLNTKFCYYNNYSLSQPRYFCKTCRRYWTQGGTLRNVPVGGGCRKGKRTKASSSSSSSPSSRSPQQQQPPPLIPSNPMITGATRTEEESGALASSAVGSYYPGGGFLSSLAAIQSMNQPQSLSFNQQPAALNQALGIVGDFGTGSPNLGLLQGYSSSTAALPHVPSFGSTHHPIQPAQFFELGNREKTTSAADMFPCIEDRLIPSSRAGAGSSHDQNNWHQSLFGGPNPAVSEPGLWSINSSSSPSSSSAGNTNTTTTTNTAGASSFNPNQWPGFPGYGAPP